MSKLYYDHLVSFSKLEKYINKISTTKYDKKELWEIVDEVVHHKTLGCILDNLDEKHHEEFLVRLYNGPHGKDIWKYLKKKIKIDIEEFIRIELVSLENEIMTELKRDTKSKK